MIKRLQFEWVEASRVEYAMPVYCYVTDVFVSDFKTFISSIHQRSLWFLIPSFVLNYEPAREAFQLINSSFFHTIDVDYPLAFDEAIM